MSISSQISPSNQPKTCLAREGFSGSHSSVTSWSRRKITETPSDFEATTNNFSAGAIDVETALNSLAAKLHGALVLDAAILVYINFFFFDGSEHLAPLSLLIPFVMARQGRNLFIKKSNRNLSQREIRSLSSKSFLVWSLLSFALRLFLAIRFLNWVDSLWCALIFILAYPIAAMMHIGLVHWGLKSVSDDELFDRIGLSLEQRFQYRQTTLARIID